MNSPQVHIENVEGDLFTSNSPEQQVDSIINIIITKIISESVKINLFDRSFPSHIALKIQHNQLKRKRNIVLQYKSYSAHIEQAYQIADKKIINGKQIALVLLNDMYHKSLDKFSIDPYEIDIEKIRNCADEIIEDIIKQLKKFLYKSSNVPTYKEQLEIGINVIVAHAFVECLVLENPNVTN